jgi:hypothetical protein
MIGTRLLTISAVLLLYSVRGQSQPTFTISTVSTGFMYVADAPTASVRLLPPALFSPPQSSPETIYRVGDGVSAPVVMPHQSVEYSETARKLFAQGIVGLTIVVRPNGMPTDF